MEESAREETLRRESVGTSGLFPPAQPDQPQQSPYHDSFGGATPGYQTPGQLTTFVHYLQARDFRLSETRYFLLYFPKDPRYINEKFFTVTFSDVPPYSK